MSTQSLIKIWSLQPNSTPNPKADVNSILLNDILMGRCIVHDAVNLLSLVPSSEQRLRNDGIIPMYQVVRNLNDKFKSLATERGVTIPPFAKIPADWKDETLLDLKTIHEQVTPHMAPTMGEYMEYVSELFGNSDRYHWSSLVAPYSAMVDMYMSLMTTAKEGLEGKLGKAGNEPLTYMQTIGLTESMRLYAEEITSDDMAQVAKVLREEITRVRDEAETSGWREEEAREITERYCSMVTKFFSA